MRRRFRRILRGRVLQEFARTGGEIAADTCSGEAAEGDGSTEESERETEAMDRRRRMRFAKPRPCAAAEVRVSVTNRRSMSTKSNSRDRCRGNLSESGLLRGRFSGEYAGKGQPREGGERVKRRPCWQIFLSSVEDGEDP